MQMHNWLTIVLACGLLACSDPVAPTPLMDRSLIPLPVSLVAEEGGFVLDCGTTVGKAGACPGCITAASAFLAEAGTDLSCGGPLRTVAGADARIVVSIDPGLTSAEGYGIQIDEDEIRIHGADEAGVFYAFQTLRQLLPDGARFDGDTWTLPRGRIADHPRYAWRGVMLDVVRHFVTLPDVKTLIDTMAAYKFNRLHLHLTDDQGWRIEIQSWPRLTEIGAATEAGGTPGGFYTQAEFRELVAYAAARHITIVPEIDMPGHVNAAQSAYGELSCDGEVRAPYMGTEVGFSSLCVGKPIVMQFAADVIGEVAEMTSGEWFHLGADEAYQTEPAAYAEFVTAAFALIRKAGKQPLAWGEAGGASPEGEWTVQQWLDPARVRVAAAAGAKVILSPFQHTYFDLFYDGQAEYGAFWGGLRGLDDAYEWDPAAFISGMDPDAIRGVEAAVWTEYIPDFTQVQIALFPRLLATAEVAWTPQARRDYATFGDRVGQHADRMAKLGIQYYRAEDIPWKGTRAQPSTQP